VLTYVLYSPFDLEYSYRSFHQETLSLFGDIVHNVHDLVAKAAGFLFDVVFFSLNYFVLLSNVSLLLFLNE
jgi:hypothetical protein